MNTQINKLDGWWLKEYFFSLDPGMLKLELSSPYTIWKRVQKYLYPLTGSY